MNSADLLRMALGSLLRRKTRSILTILGVVIGTSAIVIMVSLGVGMDKGFEDQLSRMGDVTVIEVSANGGFNPSISTQQNDVTLDDMAVALFKQLPGVEAVMATKNAYLKIGSGRYIAHVSVVGIDPAVMEAFGFEAEEGRLLLTNDKESMIFGKNVAYNFYNPRLRNNQASRGNVRVQRMGGGRMFGGSGGGMVEEELPPPVDLLTSKLILTSDMSYGEPQANTQSTQNTENTTAPPKPHDVKAVGILAESSSNKDYNAYMNITNLEKILEADSRATRDSQNRNSARDENRYDNISVKVADFNDVEQVQQIIQSMGFQAFSLTDILKSMKETSATIQAVLGGIGAVSLLVAAIGITNTMVMSIYERTREIGVIKVLGANLADIKKLFLIEAAIIGFAGGLVGLVLSYTVSYGLNKVGTGFLGPTSATGISVIPVELALAALAFSTFIGIVSGYSPARRAMNLSALDAIRTDT